MRFTCYLIVYYVLEHMPNLVYSLTMGGDAEMCVVASAQAMLVLHGCDE
jgi:hypothetical protein